MTADTQTVSRSQHPSRFSAPASRLRSVEPSSGSDLPLGVCKALWVGGTGDVEIVAEHDTSPVIISSVPAGTLLPIRAKQVLDAGTSATNIVALY